MAIAGFLGCDSRNIHDLRALELASQTLTSRLIDRIREELSLVYSLHAGSSPGVAYEDSGLFITQSTCDPANASKVVDEAHRIFGSFADTGPTAEELENAKKQIKNNLDESMREPGYWLGVLRDLDYHDKSLEDEKAEPTAYEPYTTEEVMKVFRKYYKPKRLFSVTAVPIAPAETEE